MRTEGKAKVRGVFTCRNEDIDSIRAVRSTRVTSGCVLLHTYKSFEFIAFIVMNSTAVGACQDFDCDVRIRVVLVPAFNIVERTNRNIQ